MFFYQHNNSGRLRHVDPVIYSDFNFAMHLHSDLEMALVLEGNLTLQLRDREEEIHAGEIALILCHELHAYRTVQHSKAFVCVFSPDYVDSFVQSVKGMRGERSVFACPAGLLSYIHEIFSHQAPSDLQLKAVFYAVCAQFAASTSMVPSATAPDNMLEQLILYVEQHFREDISLGQAAQALGYNRNYLSRQFHQMLSMNFRSFVNFQRVQYICHQMRVGSDSISSYALSGGFQSLRNFNRAFHEVMGMTPREYLSQTARKP